MRKLISVALISLALFLGAAATNVALAQGMDNNPGNMNQGSGNTGNLNPGSSSAQVNITAATAIKIAENKIGGTATDVILAKLNGQKTYFVKIGNQVVEVNANDGSVTGVKNIDNISSDNNQS